MGLRYAVGTGHSQALGVGSDVASYTSWTAADAPAVDWSAIVSSDDNDLGIITYLAIRAADGALYGWGGNPNDLLLQGTTSDENAPVLVLAGPVASVAVGWTSVYVVKGDGTLWVWGANSSYQLGLGDTTPRAAPVQVGSATNWASVHAFADWAIARKTDGTLWSCGSNYAGATGQGTDVGSTQSWTQIGSAADWIAVGAGESHALARKSGGTLYRWGFGGAVGPNPLADILTPTQVGTATDWAGFAVGKDNACAWKTGGTAYVVGNNMNGQLGLGDPLLTADDFTLLAGISVANAFMLSWASASVFVDTSGAAYGAGLNGNYVLGLPLDWTDYPSPTALSLGANLAGYTSSGGVAQALVPAAVETGDSSAPTTLTVTAGVYAPTTLTVTAASGIASAATTLYITASGAASAPTALAVIDASDTVRWSARCLIGGVDVSAQLVGRASVSAAEGAARIAVLTLKPPAGAIDPLAYVGQAIILDFLQLVGAAEVARRLFTGRIDTPDYEPDTTLLTLTCVDDLQNRVALLERSVLDALIGGKYSAAVQGEIDDNWDYAEALLGTVAASLDAGASGGMRVTPWQGAATWATYTEADLLYQRASLSLPQRSTMVNRVAIEFDYRYPRLRQRYTSIGWSGTHVDMAPCGWQYPTQQDLLGAAGGSGWQVVLGVFYPAPAAVPHASGGFIYPQEGAIDMAILHLAQRHHQTVTERYSLTVEAPESIAANGVLPQALRGALQSTFDGGAWESATDIEPLLPDGGDIDWAPDAPRSDADHAISTLLDQARVRILASHRSARVGNAVLCNPDLDVDKRVAIATAAIAAEGKVASVTHTLDFDAGSALSEFELALFGAGGAGIITPDTLDPPAAPDEAAETQDWPNSVPSLFVNTYGVTAYSDSIMGLLLNPPATISVEDIPGVGSQSFANPFYIAGSYPVTGFRVQMPGVDDADRNPLDKPAAATYSIVVPADTLSFTIP